MGICKSYFEKRKLNLCDKKNTKRFVPQFTYAKVVNVYDGDTVTLAAFLKNAKKPYLFRCRLARIDAPEMTKQTGRTKRDRLREKELAINSRDALRQFIDNKIVDVEILKLEKYGRVLAELYYKKTNVSDWMVKHKFAVPYDGGTKKRW